MAGEYAYSFSLSLAVLFLGLFACAVREGRYRGWAAVVLAGCVLSHIVPGMYALGGAVILTIVELLPARWGIGDYGAARLAAATPRGAGAVGHARCGGPARPWRIGLLLSGWWLVPFGLEHAYSSSMGYTNVEGWAQYFREADAWALVLAGIGVITAVVVRSRFGITVTVLGIASAVATALDPQGSLYNVRLLPLWFLSVYFMAAWAFGTGLHRRGDGVAPGAGPSLAHDADGRGGPVVPPAACGRPRPVRRTRPRARAHRRRRAPSAS